MIIIGIPKSIIFKHLARLNFSALNTKKVMTRFIIKYGSIMYFIIYSGFIICSYLFIALNICKAS